MFGDVLPDDFFCEKAGRRTAAAFGLWLFLPGSKGIGTDAMSGCHFAIGAIFKFCKDFFTDMGWIGHDFDVVTVFLLFNYISKDGFGDEYRVQHFWETEVRHAVNEGFDDFFARKADV